MWTQCWLNYCEDKENSLDYADYFSALYVEGFRNESDCKEMFDLCAAATSDQSITGVDSDSNTVNYGISAPRLQNAYNEIQIAANKLYGKECKLATALPQEGIVIRQVDDDSLGLEGYHLYCDNKVVFIEGVTTAAIIYGTFCFLALVRTGEWQEDTDVTEVPSNPIRMLDHWDNMDGSIERGYSGNSFFFKDNEIILDERTKDYARLIASIGINAVAINNVNVKDAATDLVNDRYIDKVARLSELFDGYGIKLFLSLNYAMPIEYEPASADPLEPLVSEWWRTKMTDIYRSIPKLGGFLVKADSEGRPGPFTYGRTQADGANMLAEAIRPHGGLIIWRCFVYNCQQDWRDLRIDRARAGYDYFSSLDGQFADNVILQIKNGPMDFQPREPISPLFGGLRLTNQMLEVQIAQEYTGHQIDVCYLIPWFKEILAFETYMYGENAPQDTTVAGIISGRARQGAKGGMVAVTNTGDDENWTGNDLAAANLYGFGRLAWDTSLSAKQIANEWIKLTFVIGDDVAHIEAEIAIEGNGQENIDDNEATEVYSIIEDILMNSWPAYEKYTAPLGIGWMVSPHGHYGPNVEGYEYDRWGTYIRADWRAVGVERGPQGTGFSLQYNSPNKEIYSQMDTTPDELMLFFHKTPYDYLLKSGKTVIQHIYDSHFEGYEEAKRMQKAWQSLKGKISVRSYENVAERFERQVANAREWCDIVNSYFYRRCGIADEKGRTIY